MQRATKLNLPKRHQTRRRSNKILPTGPFPPCPLIHQRKTKSEQEGQGTARHKAKANKARRGKARQGKANQRKGKATQLKANQPRADQPRHNKLKGRQSQTQRQKTNDHRLYLPPLSSTRVPPVSNSTPRLDPLRECDTDEPTPFEPATDDTTAAAAAAAASLS